MVFESVLVQVLNRVLGDYVENLDTNQLNVGIWGGDVELKNLVLKQSALDDLDLPVQTVYGQIGSLVLKIPWKNLYGAAFIINVSDIYLLAVPNQQVVYDAGKEEKKTFEAKQKEIQKVEDAKKAEAAKDQPKADFTFVEKLVTQIVKNIQLNITNIHIRYEDKITRPGSPFALGITLANLHVVSTNDEWKKSITVENVSRIFKVISLDSLAVYWNCNTTSYSDINTLDLLDKLTKSIATKCSTPEGFSYILGPINAEARLKMNQKPELDSPAFSVPKFNLNLDLEKLFIGMNKNQYRDILALVESMDRMSKGIPYRKYRPKVGSYHGHSKEWWRFAYTCILEGEIRRKKRDWDWNHIASHRNMCKEYRALYQKKLQSLAKPPDIQRLQDCEKHLDLTSIVIIRQRIELETERLAKTQEKAETKSWFGWMWGSDKSSQSEMSTTTEILKQFEDAMTPEEKARLYKAIDYQENAAPAQYPEKYVDTTCTFLLRTLQIGLNSEKKESVMVSNLMGVTCCLEMRPAASAIKLNVKIDDLTMHGLKQEEYLPEIVKSNRTEINNLLEVVFETNPLDKTCDQRLHLKSNELLITYDAQTVLQIIDIFNVPSSSSLEIAAAAGNRISNVKEMTATGLQHAIEQHSHLDLHISFLAPIVIIPHSGKFSENQNLLVANLGNLTINTLDRTNKEFVNIRKLHADGTEKEDILKEMIEQSYDQFKLELTHLQILLAKSGENWRNTITESNISDMHILHPITVNLTYSKCLISDDPRLPLNKIAGQLPCLNLVISDFRLLMLLQLGASIPLPEAEAPEPGPLSKQRSFGSSMMMLKYLEIQEEAKKTKERLPVSKDFIQFTTFDFNFVVRQLLFKVVHQASFESTKRDLLQLKISNLEGDFIQQTYNTRVSLQLASIALQHFRKDSTVNIISCPQTNKEALFKVEFTQVDSKSPELHSTYKSCESRLVLDFGKLNIILHQEVLIDCHDFALNLFGKLQKSVEAVETELAASNVKYKKMDSDRLKTRLTTIKENAVMKTHNAVKKKTAKQQIKKIVVEKIKFKLNAKLDNVMVVFESDDYQISQCSVSGLKADVIVKDPYMQIDATLKNIAILDLNLHTLHPVILSATEDNALTVQVLIYNLEQEQSNKPDMAIKATMGSLRIVFVNWFVNNMLGFLNNFQATQNAIIEASKEAAQSAKENMMDAYQKATKIELSIDLKAPDIIIPVAASDLNALHLDLGRISLVNTFKMLEVTHKESGFKAVIDDLQMKLTELSMTRVVLNQSAETIKSVLLLQPVSFSLNIKRNLSSSWYKEAPDVVLIGRLEKIKVDLSQNDYLMVMSILSGNLMEGQPKAAPTVKKNDGHGLEGFSRQLSVQTSESSKSEPTLSKTTVVLKFIMSMDELNINLFTGKMGEQLLHDPKEHLAWFSLQGLTLQGRILSDNSITTLLLLSNCLLEDRRIGREDKLNRLIHRKLSCDSTATSSSSLSQSGSKKSMLDVTLHMKQGETFADVRVNSFTVILSMDYLMKIAAFFNSQNPQEKVVVPESASGVQTNRKSMYKVPSNLSEVESSTQFTVNLKLEQPDIILVEHMNNINTNAMILNSEIIVKLRMFGKHQVVNGAIKDLQLYTCCYNPELRAQTRADILYPVTVSLAGSTPEGKGLHMELIVTDIHLSVSPTSIELLNRVLITMSSSATTTDSNQSEENDHLHENLWLQKPITETNHWYLKTVMGVDALEDIDITTPESPQKENILPELCMVAIDLIVITVESGVGNKTVPLLTLESKLNASIKNWSSQMSVEAFLSLQMGYFNSRLAIWEPLMEPVEIGRLQTPKFSPWELKVTISMNDEENDTSVATPEDFAPAEVTMQANMTIDISAENNLEMTVTKTCLEVLQHLGQGFAQAMQLGDINQKNVSSVNNFSPYQIINDTGLDVTILLEDAAFIVPEQEDLKEVLLEDKALVNLEMKEQDSRGNVRLDKELLRSSSNKDFFIHAKINEKNCNLVLPIVRADKRYFTMNYRSENGKDTWGVISEIILDQGVTKLTLRSILQVYNHFTVPIDVYFMTQQGFELKFISSVLPNACLNVPLNAVYTPTNELFFSVDGYSVTSTPFIWKELQMNPAVSKVLSCQPKNLSETSPFIMKVLGEMEQVYFEQTTRHTMASTCYNIHLRPAVVFRNCLPLAVKCSINEQREEYNVEPGDTLQLPSVEPGSTSMLLMLEGYLEQFWTCKKDILSNGPEFEVWTFSSAEGTSKANLDLGVHTINKNGSQALTLYCPFWMLNKTGLLLGYRTSDEQFNILHHPPDYKGPILFSFAAKHFFGKKKASIRIEQGEWSDKFSLDVAGSSGVVQCKVKTRKYQVGVQNQLTYNGLTKQVTFTPYYVIINNSPYEIECQEFDRPGDPWIKVAAKACTALWPRSDKEDKCLNLRIAGTREVSKHFLYTESHNTLLKLDNKYGGINVDIQLTEGGVYISLAEFEDGMAPALIVNHTNEVIKFWEQDTQQIWDLQPKHSMLYTWDNPSGPRKLVWEKEPMKNIQSGLRKDAVGNFKVPAKETEAFWASFLDGMQRVLLFTEDRTLAEGSQASNLFEIVDREIQVSIPGVGISLVNNLTRQEILYIGIASSGVVWEQCKLSSFRFKPMSLMESMQLEMAFQRFKQNDSSNNLARVFLDSRTEVDFVTEMMLKPNKRKIRRSFQTGLWLQMKTSPSQMQLHAKVNRLQIDNQMFDCIFPVILAPVPPPKSVAANSGIKPFMEVSIVELLLKNSPVRQYKYFKVLIQEFHVKVDMGFVSAISSLLEARAASEEDEKQQFLKDSHLVEEDLFALVSTQSLQEQKSFYDLLHFSPLKIHVSFSMASSSNSSQSSAIPHFINVLLQGLGVTLTDLQDVVFKLAYFERQYTFLTQKQLISQATSHYIGQSVKQLYVLVLGLDVLGNPYGLVLGITKGVEDLFYEPFQGAIQGPGEFAEGLVLGFRSLFGHTVGGAAGAVSRITGAMGKGIAALTFDDDYQRRRRDNLNKKPQTVQEGIARSGKGLVMGVFDGVTGVFTKPVSGAKEQGVEGFFKGLGKGAVGLVARPAAGVIDFASGSLDVVKRATEVGEDTLRLRPPRLLPADGSVRPYVFREAEGNKLLLDTSKGKYASTDVYVYHQHVIEKKEVVLLTDKRIAYIVHNDIFGGWQVEWSYTWPELTQPASVVSKGVCINTGEGRKKKLFGSNDSAKVIILGDANAKEMLCAQIEALRS